MALVIGGFWFWALIVLAFGLITFFVEHDRKSNGWLALMAACGGLWVFLAAQGWSNWKAILEFATENPGQLIGLCVAYISVGLLWSMYKWSRFVNRSKQKALKYVKSSYDGSIDPWNRAPKASDHMEDILMWMSYWPFSIWWRFLQDPVRWIFVKVYEFFEFQFDQISESRFKEVNEMSKQKMAQHAASKKA